jgi:hypothetical protein
VDTSATETKKITASALVGAGMTAGVTNVDINSGSIDGTTIGASSASTGAFTTLTTSSTVTLSGGTANGVLYLNGSKVATSGSAFVFDGTNVGIGTSSPATKLDTAGTVRSTAQTVPSSGTGAELFYDATNAGLRGYNRTGSAYVNLVLNDNMYVGGGSSGNVGIGTSSPSVKLHIVGGARIQDSTSASNYITIGSGNEAPYGNNSIVAQTGSFNIGTVAASTSLFLITAGTSKATLDSSGNLGLGVTPSLWSTSYRAFEFGSGSLMGRSTNTDIYLLSNSYLNTSGNFVYKSSAAAGYYSQAAGAHYWYRSTDVTPTAGNTISFTQAMTLDASGNLLVGTTSAPNGGSARDVVLHNTNSAATYLKISNASTGATSSDGFDLIMGTSSDAYAFNRENGPLIFGTNNTERARITNVGNFGIANTDPNYNLSVGTPGSTAASYIQLGSTTTGTGSLFFGDTTGTGSGSFRGYVQYDHNIDALIFGSAATNQARISSTGLFLVNIDSSTGYGDGHRIYRNVSEGGFILSVDGGGEYAALFQDVASGGYSTAAAGIWVGKNSSNSRSINAGGTVNASGADYAEYMEKAGDFVIAKGDVCGIDADGKLTNVYANAVAFVVKSTNPSYVGGDSWGAGYKDDPEGLEAARQKVDRIAFSGQVPVNVLGATPGQYIVPVNDNGAIKGVAVSNPSFEQYQTAVGKVIAIEDDGRARIIVKIA